MREHADRLRGPDWILVDDDEELTEHVVETLRTMQRHQTAAVILNDPEAAAAFHDRCRNVLTAEMVDAELSERIDLSRRHVRHFTSVTHAKGLEFDVVIVPYLERYDLADPTHVNRLYVALTRSRRKLVLLSHASRPTSAFDRVWERYENTVARI
jgi:DNA helicase IV